jgi:hypothetical protein
MARVTTCPNSPDAAYVVPNFAQRQVAGIAVLRKFPGIDLQLYLQPVQTDALRFCATKKLRQLPFREAAALVISTKK